MSNLGGSEKGECIQKKCAWQQLSIVRGDDSAVSFYANTAWFRWKRETKLIPLQFELNVGKREDVAAKIVQSGG